MSGGWQSQKIGSLAELRNGVNFGREDEEIGTPIIKVKDFGDLHHVPIEGLERLKRKWSTVEALVGSEKRLRMAAEDLVAHFEARVQAMDGKAMAVCMSRRICVDLYN